MLRALVYFALVFGVGFLLGPIRVLWLAPRLGERTAELVEMPFMLAASLLAARWTLRRFPAARRSAALASGLLALGLVLLAEIGVVLILRGTTLHEYVAERDPVSGLVYLATLALFAVMPWLCWRSASGW